MARLQFQLSPVPGHSRQPLSGTQQVGVVFLKAASRTCRSLRGSGDGVGGSIDKLN
jgi:hypothetical protein